jgi:hypothetical protein
MILAGMNDDNGVVWPSSAGKRWMTRAEAEVDSVDGLTAKMPKAAASLVVMTDTLTSKLREEGEKPQHEVFPTVLPLRDSMPSWNFDRWRQLCFLAHRETARLAAHSSLKRRFSF